MSVAIQWLGASWSRRRALWDLTFLTMASVPVWWLLLRPGYLDTHDGLFHLFRLVEFDRVFREGELYPRLAPNLALGYDYPVFNYYSPLVLYIGEAFRLLGLGYIDAMKACYVVGILTAGWAMWLFARDWMPRGAALLSALAHISLPYLLVDVYFRGNLAEALALAWLPACLWSLSRLAGRPSARSVVMAATCLAGLVLTHVVTTVLFGFVAAAWWPMAVWRATVPGQQEPDPLGEAIVSAAPRGQARYMIRLLSVLPAVALAAAISAFYIVPAVLERDLVQNERLVEDFFSYREHFQPIAQIVQTSFGYDYGYDFFSNTLYRLGLTQLLLSIVGLGAGLLLGRTRRREALFWMAALVGSTLLLTTRSRPLWDAVPLIGYAQFPWRFLADARLASAVLIGLIAAAALVLAMRLRLPARWRKPTETGVWLAVAAVLVASSLPSLHPYWLALSEYEARPWTIQRQELDRKLVVATIGEYLPRWVSVSPFDLKTLPAEGPQSRPAEVQVDGYGTFGYHISVTATQDTAIGFDRFYYPGWWARIDGRQVEPRAEGPLGLLTVDVPAGGHTVELGFGETPLRKIGWALSLVSVVSILIALLWPSLARIRPARRTTIVALIMATSGVAGSLLWGPAVSPVEAKIAVPGRPVMGGIGLAGASIGAPDARGRLPVTLLWHTPARVDGDRTVALRLLDQDGNVVGRRDQQPLFGLRPTRLWEAGMLVRDHQEIALLAGVPSGQYRLVVALRDASGGWLPMVGEAERAQWQEADGAMAAGMPLGLISMPTFAQAEAPALPNLAGVAMGSARLESYSVSLESGRGETPGSKGDLATVAPGASLAVDYRWVAERDFAADYAVFVHLLDVRQQMLGQGDEWPHRGFYPTSLWLPGERIADRLGLPIPPDLPIGRYTVVTGMYSRSTMQRLAVVKDGATSDRYVLGTVKVSPALLASGLPSPQRKQSARLETGIQLLGTDVDAIGPKGFAPAPAAWMAGSKVAVTVYWSSESTPKEDFTAFVHVIGPDGRLVTQHDSQPSEGNYPTTAWEPGEVVPDRHVVTIPPGAAPGKYQLVGGLYRLATGQRLKVDSGGDSVPLGELTVRLGG
jgi:hypothetical protein